MAWVDGGDLFGQEAVQHVSQTELQQAAGGELRPDGKKYTASRRQRAPCRMTGEGRGQKGREIRRDIDFPER